jgi:hypothetical protein
MRPRFALVACAIGALTLSTAWASTVFNTSTAPSGAHYANGAGEPVCTLSGLTMTCSGTQIGGIGSNDANVLLTVSYSATVQCRNRGDQIVDVKTQQTTSSGSDSDTRVRNGQLTVSPVSSTGPTNQQFEQRASCPNGNWTKETVDGTQAVTSYRYTLTFIGYTESAIVVP